MARERRTYADRAQYFIEAVKKRRKKVKLMAVEHLGGKCQMCGYDRCPEALEFHHIDETKKTFAIGARGYTRSWDKVRNEIEKCFLLCANCHREVHAGVLQLPQAIAVEKRG